MLGSHLVLCLYLWGHCWVEPCLQHRLSKCKVQCAADSEESPKVFLFVHFSDSSTKVEVLREVGSLCSWASVFSSVWWGIKITTCSSIWNGFPGSAVGKEPACQCSRRKRHGFNPWVGEIPWRRAWQPTAVFLPGQSHGQRHHRVAKSQTWLKRVSACTHTHTHTHTHSMKRS